MSTPSLFSYRFLAMFLLSSFPFHCNAFLPFYLLLCLFSFFLQFFNFSTFHFFLIQSRSIRLSLSLLFFHSLPSSYLSFPSTPSSLHLFPSLPTSSLFTFLPSCRFLSFSSLSLPCLYLFHLPVLIFSSHAEGQLEVLKENKVLGTMNAGRTFGELALLYNCNRTASVRGELSICLRFLFFLFSLCLFKLGLLG